MRRGPSTWRARSLSATPPVAASWPATSPARTGRCSTPTSPSGRTSCSKIPEQAFDPAGTVRCHDRAVGGQRHRDRARRSSPRWSRVEIDPCGLAVRVASRWPRSARRRPSPPFYLTCWRELLGRLTEGDSGRSACVCDGRSYEGLDRALGLVRARAAARERTPRFDDVVLEEALARDRGTRPS